MKAFIKIYVLKKEIEVLYGLNRCYCSFERIIIEYELLCPVNTFHGIHLLFIQIFEKVSADVIQKKGHPN